MQVTKKPNGYYDPHTQGATNAKKSAAASSAEKSNPHNAAAAQAQDDPAAILTLSKEAKAELLANKKDSLPHAEMGELVFGPDDFYDSGLFLKMDADGKPISDNDKVFIIPFGSNEVEYAASVYLYGKVDNYNEVAAELGQLLKSYNYGNGETVEERVVNRETGLKLAEYLAKTYLDDPDEAADFMKRVNQSAEYDELREKGYNAFEGSEYPPWKPYSMPNAPEGYVHGTNKFMAEKLGWNLDDIGGDVNKFREFARASLSAWSKNHAAWKDEIVNSFAENEKSVTEAMKKAKDSLTEEQLQGNLQELFAKLGL